MNDARIAEIVYETCGIAGVVYIDELIDALRESQAREAKLRETIIQKLNERTKNMEYYDYFGSNMGVSEDDYEEIADAVCEALKETKP